MAHAQLTPGQQAYVKVLVHRTGMNSRVATAWVLAEEGGANSAAAQGREHQGNHNWLNIGPGRTYRTPAEGAAAAADLVNKSGYYAGIRRAIASGSSASELQAIAASPWDAGHYHGGASLQATFGSATGMHDVGAAVPPSHTSAPTAPHFVPGSTAPDTNGAIIAALTDHRHGGSLLSRIQGAINSGQYTNTTPGHWAGGHPGTTTPAPGSPDGPHHGKFDIKELFWQGPGGIDIKNGQVEPQGFVSGHTDHVHVGSGPKQVVRLGKLAQSMGLRVAENPHFGGVHPVHVQGSLHYRDEAIDVSGPVAAMKAYAHKVAALRN